MKTIDSINWNHSTVGQTPDTGQVAGLRADTDYERENSEPTSKMANHPKDYELQLSELRFVEPSGG